MDVILILTIGVVSGAVGAAIGFLAGSEINIKEAQGVIEGLNKALTRAQRQRDEHELAWKRASARANRLEIEKRTLYVALEEANNGRYHDKKGRFTTREKYYRELGLPEYAKVGIDMVCKKAS